MQSTVEISKKGVMICSDVIATRLYVPISPLSAEYLAEKMSLCVALTSLSIRILFDDWSYCRS